MQIEQALEIINEADPQGLLKMGAPEGEYTVEAAAITGRLEPHMTKEQVLDLVYGVFVAMFNKKLAGEREHYRPIAVKMFEVMQVQ